MVLSATAQSSVPFSLSRFSDLSKMRPSCKVGIDHWGNIKSRLIQGIVQFSKRRQEQTFETFVEIEK